VLGKVEMLSLFTKLLDCDSLRTRLCPETTSTVAYSPNHRLNIPFKLLDILRLLELCGVQGIPGLISFN